jgi:DNA-binding MarR family transcriptional regulator
MIQIKPSASGKPSGAGGCTCFKLRRLTRRVTAVYDRALSDAGMRVTQYSLLAHLRGLRGVAVSQLAEMLDMDRTTLTRNLRPLVEAGWIAVKPSAEDARIRLVHITPSGETRWQAARVCWRQAQQEVSSTIGSDGLAELHRMLDNYVPLFRAVPGEQGEAK